MAQAQRHDVLMLAGAGAAAFAGWEFIYKPWKAAQLAATAGSVTAPYSPPPPGAASGGVYVTSPTAITPQPITPSNLNPGAQVGGAVGTCMSRKGWPQGQCQTRLDQIVAAYQWNKARIGAMSPGGSELLKIQAQLAATQAVLAQSNANYNAAVAAGDAAGQLAWKHAIDQHSADVDALGLALSTASSAITASQSAMAGLASDYLALTGLTLQ